MWRLVSTWETTRSGSIRKRDWQMGHVLSFSPSAAADVYLCLFVLVILKHCYSSFHPFSNLQQVHFCKYSHEAESMEAAKSQFSYICLSCQALLKARKRVLAIHVGRATFNYWEFWISDGKHNCLWCWWGRNMPFGWSCIVLLSRKGDSVLYQRLDWSWILS